MKAFISGIAMLGPGLSGWTESTPILRGDAPHVPQELKLPAPDILSPVERRRSSPSVRLAIAVANQAMELAGLAPGSLPTVFGTSNGDGQVVHAILEVLASSDRRVSPTHFHNSVHNAAAGYWSIGTKSHAASTSIGCYDDTFAAALIDAAAQAAAERRPVLACAYDTPLPSPLAEVRHTSIPFGVALVLTPDQGLRSLGRLTITFRGEPAGEGSAPKNASLREIYLGNPAARALPLLELLARQESGLVRLPFLDNAAIEIATEPCSTMTLSHG